MTKKRYRRSIKRKHAAEVEYNEHMMELCNKAKDDTDYDDEYEAWILTNPSPTLEDFHNKFPFIHIHHDEDWFEFYYEEVSAAYLDALVEHRRLHPRTPRQIESLSTYELHQLYSKQIYPQVTFTQYGPHPISMELFVAISAESPRPETYDSLLHFAETHNFPIPFPPSDFEQYGHERRVDPLQYLLHETRESEDWDFEKDELPSILQEDSYRDIENNEESASYEAGTYGGDIDYEGEDGFQESSDYYNEMEARYGHEDDYSEDGEA